METRTAIHVKRHKFWHIIPYSLVDRYKGFGGIAYFHSLLQIWAENAHKLSVLIYQPAEFYELIIRFCGT